MQFKGNIMKQIYLFLLFPIFCKSQDTAHISFNSKLNYGEAKVNYSFHFSEGDNEKTILNNDINQYFFKLPGLYRIETRSTKSKAKFFSKLNPDQTNSDCNELILPPVFYVYVDSILIKYKAESINTTRPICKNNPTDSISLLIDVEITNYFQSTVSMDMTPIFSAGVGTEIIGKLSEKFKNLKPGLHTLQYNLSGIATMASYIQFDFRDYQGHTVPIGLKEMIKDCTR